MNVRFTGRHVGIADEDREYAEAKAVALERFHRRILDLEVRVSKDGGVVERVELQADLGRRRAVAVAEAPGFRAAFDGAVETLKGQLLRQKEKTESRRRRPARRASAEGRSR